MNTKAMKGLDFNSHWACKLSASFFSYIQVEHCDQAFQALFFHPSSWTVWWGRPQRQRGIHPETGQCGHVNHDLLPSCFLLYCLLLAAKHSALSSPSTWNTTSSCAGSILTMRSDLVGLLPRIRTSTVFSATEILTVYSPPFNFLFLALVIGSEEAAPLSNRSKVSVSPSDSFLTAASFLSWTIFCSWELAVSDWFFSVLLVTNLQMVWQVGRILKKRHCLRRFPPFQQAHWTISPPGTLSPSSVAVPPWLHFEQGQWPVLWIQKAADNDVCIITSGTWKQPFRLAENKKSHWGLRHGKN